MSNTKTVMSQAANTLVKPLEVEDVFSTYVYAGTGAARSINNGIDLAGEGGLVWIKNRIASYHHHWYDTERGIYNYIQSSLTTAQTNETDTLTAFNSNGFTLSSDIDVNRDIQDFASWTFRKAPKFFDVVTYTGDGIAGKTISHNLGSVPGCIIVKATSGTGDWEVYHRGADATAPEDYAFQLNQVSARADLSNRWNDTAPTSTHFTVGDNGNVNANGFTYVAYIFAHNDGDGGFNGGDIIKCGSYTGNGSTDGPEIDLGFEPQWVLIKETDATGNWQLFDSMRGMVADGVDARIAPNLSNAEDSIQSLTPTATGFKINTTSGNLNTNNSDHIYIAIRRGTKVPESGTEVFAADDETYTTLPQFYSGWPVDFALRRLNKSGSTFTRVLDRLRGNKFLNSASTAAEASLTIDWDVMDGFSVGTSSDADDFSWMWKRAPGFFDVVAYTGNSSNRNLSHNLAVEPEMVWFKSRSSAVDWIVYHKDLGGTYPSSRNYLYLNQNSGVVTPYQPFTAAPTASTMALSASSGTNSSSSTYIAYLFASLPGISKVGSYTGTGAALNIDCGFTSGARFVLIKRTDNQSPWWMWDSERGIIAGNDPLLELNSTAAEVTNTDYIDPYSAGFTLTSNGNWLYGMNYPSGEYIFYAIA